MELFKDTIEHHLNTCFRAQNIDGYTSKQEVKDKVTEYFARSVTYSDECAGCFSKFIHFIFKTFFFPSWQTKIINTFWKTKLLSIACDEGHSLQGLDPKTTEVVKKVRISLQSRSIFPEYTNIIASAEKWDDLVKSSRKITI